MHLGAEPQAAPLRRARVPARTARRTARAPSRGRCSCRPSATPLPESPQLRRVLDEMGIREVEQKHMQQQAELMLPSHNV